MSELPRSLAENRHLDRWIAFESDRSVQLKTGKVELGQGILTALVQIAAEELDLDPARVQVLSGDTSRAPNEFYTAGSLSIELSGASIRLVCAEVRRIFLDQLAAELGCERAELSVADGRFLRGQSDTGFDYWSFAPRVDLAREATGTVPVKHVSEHRVVGRSLPRLDLPAKLSGAPFLQDLHAEGLLHARVLRQPWRGARLEDLGDGAIRRAAPGIEIVRQGDFVAFVSESEILARRALERARQTARWKGHGPPEDAGAPGRLLGMPTIERTIEVSDEPAKSPVHVAEATFSRPYLAHGSIGLCCAIAMFAGGDLEVISHTQGVYPLRTALAEALGLDEERIRVRHHQGAGCYGHNGADDVALDASLVAMRFPGRAVRAQWDRIDELSAEPFGPAMVVKIEAGLDAGYLPLDWTLHVWSAVHGQRPGINKSPMLASEALPDPPPRPPPVDLPDATGGGATRNAAAIYGFPRQKVVHHLIADPGVRTSTLRSLGAFINVFAIECFLDELADLAGEDPVRYRLALLSDPRARRVIETAAAMANWASGRGDLGSVRAKGLGFARYKNRGGYAAVVAEVEAEQNIRLLRMWCAADGGLIVNPDGAVNQIEGGMIQAASWTLKEEVRFAEGRVASTSWETYPILKFSEVPEIDIRLVDTRDEPSGLGEVVQGPTAAAIGNAAARALGIRIRDLPLTRERIAAALLGA
jgi:CO/xanthine dehydrogenase Mo-binding subunit